MTLRSRYGRAAARPYHCIFSKPQLDCYTSYRRTSKSESFSISLIGWSGEPIQPLASNDPVGTRCSASGLGYGHALPLHVFKASRGCHTSYGTRSKSHGRAAAHPYHGIFSPLAKGPRGLARQGL